MKKLVFVPILLTFLTVYGKATVYVEDM